MRYPSPVTLFSVVSIVLITLMIVSFGAQFAGAVIYVDASATGADDGTSWTDAFTDLQDALAAAAMSSDDIWVAAGTYLPTGAADRTISFQLLNNVAVYGGFDGTEVALGERELPTNITILSGDIGIVDDPSDNSYHVVTGHGTGSSAVLDGFTVTGGNADGAGIEDQNGGGIYNEAGSPTLRNLTVTVNSAAYGGGISNRNGAAPVIVNTVVRDNSGVFGGGLNNLVSSPTITNSLFTNNTASTSGGAISNANNSSPTVTNSIVWTNTAPNRPSVYNTPNSLPVFAHCDVEGAIELGVWDTEMGVDGGDNLTADPVFADAPNDDFHATLHSPTINAGDNTAPGIPTEDLDGNARIFGAAVDMGPYELVVVCPPGPVVFVDKDAMGTADGTSWTDAYLEARDAFVMASMCPAIEEIWIAEGDYTPTPVVNRATTFVLRNGLEVYGGFAGGELNREDREPRVNTTSLKGWVNYQNDAAYHVLVARDVDSTTVLDGITVAFGNGGYIPVGDDGKGGGILIVNGSPRINDVRFEQNTSTFGGAVYIDGGNPKFTDVWFYFNGVSPHEDGDGGGVYNNGGDPVFSNCVFVSNQAGKGGAIYNAGGSPIIANSTFTGNHSYNGISMYVESGSPATINSILWNTNSIDADQIIVDPGATPVFSYSDVQESGGSGAAWNPLFGVDGGNNIDLDPLFADGGIVEGLRAASPAVNAGDNGAPYLLPTDYNGEPRIVDSVVDMGAFEFQYECPPYSIYYVDQDATGANDGSSWADAFNELRDAIALACANIDEIWVASGVYKPDGGADRSAIFRLHSGMALYGGFAGGEGSIAERDIDANPTILSGDLGVEGDPADNSYRILLSEYTDNTVVLDGFIVTNGNSIGGGSGYAGGGYFCTNSSPTIRNVIFDGNNSQGGGGGLCFYQGSPVLDNVTFTNNTAYEGGGLKLVLCDAVITNAVFIGNSAHDGGAIATLRSDFTVTNALFVDNSGAVGGTLYNNGGSPVYTNITITESSASLYGGVLFVLDGIHTGGVAPEFVNMIMWGNSGPGGELIWRDPMSQPVYSYSIVQGCVGSGPSWNTDYGADLGYNLDVDPEFASPASNNYRLQGTSPAIDAGNTTAPNLLATDLDGNPRVVSADVDMGAYEYGSGTGVGDDTPSVTYQLEFQSVYPNPFNPTLTVAFELDRRREVRVVVYDVRGKFVDELFKGVRNAGPHRLTWDAVDRRGAPAASGVYFVEVQSGAWRDSRKVILLK